jgi:hypothetical protein
LSRWTVEKWWIVLVVSSGVGVAIGWDDIINYDVDWLSSDEESYLESTDITVLILTWEYSLNSLWIGGK